MAKYFKVLLFIFLLSPVYVNGWDFFGLFKKKDTTTVSPLSSATTEAAMTTTTTTESNSACWWTQCGSRCTATASVHDFSNVNCNPGQYKFRCCAT